MRSGSILGHAYSIGPSKPRRVLVRLSALRDLLENQRSPTRSLPNFSFFLPQSSNLYLLRSRKARSTPRKTQKNATVAPNQRPKSEQGQRSQDRLPGRPCDRLSDPGTPRSHPPLWDCEKQPGASAPRSRTILSGDRPLTTGRDSRISKFSSAAVSQPDEIFVRPASGVSTLNN